MRVTILGNNSALPAFGRHPSAQTVTVFGEVLLLDCGEGTQLQMQRYGVKWKNVHHIFISHLHGDHYFGLPGLINSMSLLGRIAPLHLYAPAGLRPIIDAILAVADTRLCYELHFHPLPAGTEVIADTDVFSVTCFPLQHGIECHGFLVTTKTRGRRILPDRCKEYGIAPEYFEALKRGEDHTMPDGTVVKNAWVTADGPAPKKYAYCSDTVYTESFLPLIQGADGIYHEATYLHQDAARAAMRHHSTAIQAATLAQKANARTLLLGHFSSKYKELEPFREEAATIFPNVVIGMEGMAYDL
ncbi:ribonuclease Z [Nemorincola caseinilytica]|uniref:Ribonuclease Z n=1 Tax=Nemorincola caseinilytica TaxID=2054315 RepID=A0ABP8NAK1_9BACT